MSQASSETTQKNGSPLATMPILAGLLCILLVSIVLFESFVSAAKANLVFIGFFVVVFLLSVIAVLLADIRDTLRRR